MVLCKDSGEKLEIVGLSCAECMRELLGFGVFLGTLLFVSLARNVYDETSNDWN